MLSPADACLEAARIRLPLASSVLGLQVSSADIERFAQYCSLLLTANAKFNITAIRNPDDVMLRHFLDSLSVVPHLDILETDGLDGRQLNIVDVGTGGGLPGLAVALLRPDWQITLVDSVGKKTRFVTAAAAALALQNVTVVTDRAEALGKGEFRDTFDVCLARAVAPTSVLIEYCAPLVRTGGHIFLYKNGDSATEESAARRVAPLISARLLATHTVPGELEAGPDRFFLEFQKAGATPQTFPRRLGLARSRPL